MITKRTWLNLTMALVFISVASFTITTWTTQYTYLHFKGEETFYLTGNYESDDRLISDEVKDLRRVSRSIELPIREGTIITARTELVTGDIDVDLAILVQFNESTSFIPVYSLSINSSNERVLWKNQVEIPSELRLQQYFPFGDPYPNAKLVILPVTGSGIVRIVYEVLQPVPILLYICILCIISGLTFTVKTKKSNIQAETTLQKKNILNFLIIGIIIGLIFMYFYLRNLYLFYYTISLELIIISLVLLSNYILADKITLKNPFTKTSVIFLFIISIILLLFADFFLIIFVFLSMSIFLSIILEKVNEHVGSRLFTILLITSFIIICISLVTIFLYPRLGAIFLIIIIESALIFIFVHVLNDLSTVEELSQLAKSDILKEKIAEIFDENFCYFHPSMKLKQTCPKCGKEICELCLLDYENLCILCYRSQLEDRVLFSDFLRKLGILLLFIFLIFYILGIFAPLPLVQSTISWMGLVYSRFTILIYFIIVCMILSITLIGGGTQLSRVINLKIKSIDIEILDKSINKSKTQSSL